MHKLNWKSIVGKIQAGNFEPKDSEGQTEFMYCDKRHVFISDPYLIQEIHRARSHNEPFMLIGSMNSGKNIFLELVAKGNGQGKNVDCIDENVYGNPFQMTEKFFSQGGFIENHPNALIHFDLLQNTLESNEWGPFVDKIHELARTHTLYRTDGVAVKNLSVRVVGGATKDLEPELAKEPSSSLAYLYYFLSSKQLVRTKILSEQTERIQKLLSEILASQVLNPKILVKESDIEALEKISDEELSILENHSWPGGFSELVKIVNDAIFKNSWHRAIISNIPGKVFIIWNRSNKEQAQLLHNALKAAQIPCFFSEESMVIGNWKEQIYDNLNKADLVILCITEDSFDKHGYHFNELTQVLKKHKRDSKSMDFLIPVSLDGSEPSDERWKKKKKMDNEIIDYIMEMQWFQINPIDNKGFEKLYASLKKRFSEIQKQKLQKSELR